jgi:hypothetical protein
MNTIGFDLYPRKCYVCGKRFECRMAWAYKEKKKQKKEEYFWFCSYKCMREHQSLHPIAPKDVV